MESKWKSRTASVTWTANGANKKLVLHVQLRCGSLSITTPVSDLTIEFDVRSKLGGQVSLAAVNQILCGSSGYERLQNSKESLKACFENVNIRESWCSVFTRCELEEPGNQVVLIWPGN